MDYFLEIMANAVTIVIGVGTSVYGTYQARDRIRLALYSISSWALTAFIWYIDFVAKYALDPIARIWGVIFTRMGEIIAAIILSFFDGR